MSTTNRQHKRWHHPIVSGTLAAAVAAFGTGPAAAQDAEQEIEEIVVTGDLRSLPGESVESIFGFDKSILETPRSASTVSWEQIERFNIKDIDELVVLAPGTFTQSFFGVAGSLDVRGTPGETYFRGIRRLDNPGNFPTPIGAADRVDIVRGPASPITGPSKIGGFLNFSPKSGRADSGQYLDQIEGSLSYSTGTWDRNVLTAEVGGPGSIAGKDFGFWLYAEVEDSGSFYQNTTTDNTLVQASFDMDVNDNVRIQFGGMYHNFDGNQIAGWNRVTQELIDDGTYITGSPISVDQNGDGFNSHQEFDITGDGNFDFAPFFFGVNQDANNPQSTADVIAATGLDPTTADGALILNALALQNPGTTQLRRSQVLVAADDVLQNEDYVFYLDIDYNTDSGWNFKNQMFYEQYDNINENAYGFSQFADSSVFENKLIIAKTWESDVVKTSAQLSPSIRITNFQHGDDFINEHFNRRDLTGPSTGIDRRLLATRIGTDYSTFDDGNYVNFGIAGLVDLDFGFGLNITGGVRWDTIDIESFTPGDLLLFPGPDVDVDGTVDGVSWTASASWDFGTLISDGEWSLRPYFTASEQSTLIAGQGAEINTGDLQDDAVFDTSELIEYGIKGSFLDDKLYFAVSIYEQERTDRSAQSIVTNQTNRTEGAEIEVRWAVSDKLILTAGWSDIEVVNLTTLDGGGRFSFVGTDDFPNVDPATFAGGTLGGIIFANGEGGARRAGIPENIFTLTGTYQITPEIAGNVSVIDVDAVSSGLSGSVRLPAYTLVNLGLNYQNERWFFGANLKNVTNERYFRSNFPNLFGSQIVLPELPRHYTATLQYKF